MKEVIEVINKKDSYNKLASYVSDTVPRIGEAVTIHENNVVRDYKVVDISHTLLIRDSQTNLMRIYVFVEPT